MIEAPTYDHINGIIARFISSMTGPMRGGFDWMSMDMNEYETNVVPFPHLHGLISSMAPIIPSDRNKHGGKERRKLLIDGYVRENHVLQRELLYQDIMNMLYSIYNINVDIGKDRTKLLELSEDLYNPKYFSIECLDFDAEEDKFMAISTPYRGRVKSRYVSATVYRLKLNR